MERIKYTDNANLKVDINKLLLECNITKTELANKMDCKPQQLNNILNKRNLAFTDIQRILDALGMDLYIDFVKRGTDDKDTDQV